MMFEITKFKLFKKGHNGLEVEVKTYFDSPGGRKIVEPGSRRRYLPIGSALREGINGLKYYYFILTGHWLEVYNDYFDRDLMVPKIPGKDEDYNGPWAALRDLWDKTFITGAEVKDGGFFITGFLEIIPKKPLNISTPKISLSDDYAFFQETIDCLNNLAMEMINYFSIGSILENSRDTLKEIAEYSPDDMKGLSDEEVENQLIEILESRGAIMISPTDAQMLKARKKEREPELKDTVEEEINQRPPKEGEPAIKEVSSGKEEPVAEETSEEKPETKETTEEIPAGAAAGSMDLPQEIEPDKEIGEIVSNATLDNNVPEAAPLDEEGMQRAQEMGAQEGNQGEGVEKEW